MKNWLTTIALLALTACMACGTEDDLSTEPDETTLEVVDNTTEQGLSSCPNTGPNQWPYVCSATGAMTTGLKACRATGCTTCQPACTPR
jgi:hypothetical protein